MMTETTKATHTPGPWEVESDYSPDGSDLIVMHDQCTVIADCRHDIGVSDPDVAEANARLIAAAPALLEACEIGKRELEAVSQIDEWAGHVSQWLDELPDGAAKHAARVWIYKIMAAAQSAATQIDYLAAAVALAEGGAA